MKYDVIIIGAGPAGLMCAANLSKKINYVILEKNNKPGVKLLLTGGGRCNLTNNISNKEFIETCHNSKYIYSMISNFGPNDVINYFEERNVPLKTEKNNKVFPVSNKALDILNVLKTNVNIKYKENVKDITYDNNIFLVKTSDNSFECKCLVIATGGYSYKFTGSTGDHQKFAQMLDVNLVDLYPCEASLICKIDPTLAGTSFDNVSVKYQKHEARGELIITHNGLSGSAVMQISEHIKNRDNIIIDFLPERNEADLLDLLNSLKDKELISFYNEFFTHKFSSYLAKDKCKIKELNINQRKVIVNNLKNYEISNVSVCDLDKAFITGGGIDMNSLNTSSLATKKNSNLFFIGECLDIHGPIGGFNITLALSSGCLASKTINQKFI